MTFFDLSDLSHFLTLRFYFSHCFPFHIGFTRFITYLISSNISCIFVISGNYFASGYLTTNDPLEH